MAKSNGKKGHRKGAHTRSQGTPSPTQSPNNRGPTGNNTDIIDEHHTSPTGQNVQDLQIHAEVANGIIEGFNPESNIAVEEVTNMQDEGATAGETIVDNATTEGETLPNEEKDRAASPSNASFHLHIPNIEHFERNHEDEDPNNLITPIRNINAFVSENILPVQQYVTAEAHNASTDKILSGFDTLAKMMQTLIEQRAEDREIYATNEQLTTITTNYSHLKREQDDWLKVQSNKIDERLAEAERLSKEHFENGVQALTTKLLDQCNEFSAKHIEDARTKVSKYAAQSVEYEETMRLNKLDYEESLATIKAYEEKYGRLIKDATLYRDLKAKCDAVEEKVSSIQTNVDAMVATNNGGGIIADDITSLKAEITKNRDDVDSTVAQFFKDVKKWDKEADKKAKVMTDTKKLIKEQYDKLKEWVEKIKTDQDTKDTAINSCVRQLSDLSKANTNCTELASKSVKLVTDQIEDIANLRKEVLELTKAIQSVSTNLNEALSPDDAYISNAILKFIQEGPNTPFGFDEQVFQAKVVEVLHKHYPNVSTDQIEGMLQHETEVRNEIETRIYHRVMVQLKADKNVTSKLNQSNGDGNGSSNENTPPSTNDSPNDSITLPTNSDDQPNESTGKKNEAPPNRADGDSIHDRNKGNETDGYAGYMNYETKDRQIAYLRKEHCQWRALGYIWKKDFDHLSDAIAWLNERFQTPTPPRRHNGTPSPKYTPPPNYSDPNSISSGERYQMEMNLERYEDLESCHSPEGYFGYNDRGPTGGAYYINNIGNKVLLPKVPKNMQMAGKRVPNDEECQRASNSFQREDHHQQYGPSPRSQQDFVRQDHFQHYGSRSQQHWTSPQRNYPDQQDIFHEHINRSGEFRSPNGPSQYNEVIFSNVDRKMNYMCGMEGTPALQPADFQRLGFTNPDKSYQRLSMMHYRIMKNWETTSKFGTISRGPNTLAITGNTSFTPLGSRKQTDVINWYNTLGQMLEPLNIALVPFEHIELAHEAYGLCPPGFGIYKYDEMSRALHLLLTTKLLPMHVNDDHSGLANALTLACSAELPNGYELLHVLLRHLIPAFNVDKVTIDWPIYSEHDDIFLYASAVERTVLLAAKRRQTFTEKSAALQFLDGIIAEAGQAFVVQARILRTAVSALDQYAPLPLQYHIRKMAFEIKESTPTEQPDPQLNQKPAIYKTTATMTNNEYQPPPTLAPATRQSVSFASQDADDFQSRGNVQGYSYDIYRVNRVAYKHNPERRRPARYPVPDPSKELNRKRASLYDPTIQCEACQQRGHPAVRCHALAAALYLQQFLGNKPSEEIQQRAMDHWMSRNAPVVRDTKTHEALTKSPLKVLYTYMDRTKFTVDKLMDEVDWEFFDMGGNASEVFGIVGGQQQNVSDKDEHNGSE